MAHTYYRKTDHQQTAEWVCAHLEEAEARQVMDDYLAKLGALMGNLVNVLDPSGDHILEISVKSSLSSRGLVIAQASARPRL